jgi:hypothetical protein
MTYPFLIGRSLPFRRPIASLQCQIGTHGARGAADLDQGAWEFPAKQNALPGNRCPVTEPVYKVIHQSMVCAGRAIGDGLSPVSDGQL